ncbi:MAG: cysteine rich repeat-containing protein [Dissulfurispiraceae bacterium]
MEKKIAWRCIRVQLFFLAFILLCGSAGVRTYAAEQGLPCAEEIAKFCKDVKPGEGRILNELNEHEKDLSVSCREKLEESQKRLTDAQHACAGDVEKFCKDVKPGSCRILTCLREHAKVLTSACRQITEKTTEEVQD